MTQAIRLGRMLEEFNLAWFEEPIAYYDHAGEAQIAAALDTPIASGESEYTSRGMFDMLRQKSVDILMPDLQRMGGPSEFLKAAHLAEAFDTAGGLAPLPGDEPAAPGGDAERDDLEYMPWCEPIYASASSATARAAPSCRSAPGWGFSFDPAAIRRFRIG